MKTKKTINQRFMQEAVYENLEWHIEQIALFVNEAKQKSPNQRSRYYKACYLFASSNVEALAYHLVYKNYTGGLKIKLEEKIIYKKIHSFPAEFRSSHYENKHLAICVEIPNKFEWSSSISFQKLIRIGEKMNIFSKRLVKKLDTIKKKRNRIHIQELSEADHRYTLQDVESVTSIMGELMRKWV